MLRGSFAVRFSGIAQMAALAITLMVGSAAALAGVPVGLNAHCDVEPRTFAEIERFLNAPSSVPDIPSDDSAQRSGSPSTEAVETLLNQFLTCSGSGEPLRVWSLYSDAYLARLLSRERGYDRERYALDGEPRPIPPERWPVLREVGEPSTDEWGRTVVDATIWYPNIAREKRLRFTMVWAAQGLRIDEIDGEITFSVP